MSCIGVVLAGGLSTRMGQDKALLLTHEGSLLQRTTRLLQACCDEVWVSGREQSDVYFVRDRYLQRGPVGAIHAVCEHVQKCGLVNPVLVFVPVDLPFLDASLLESLIHHEQALCHFAHHPLPAKVSRVECVLEAAQKLLEAPQSSASVSALWQMLGAYELPLTAAISRALVNANTPEQWAKYQSEVQMIRN